MLDRIAGKQDVRSSPNQQDSLGFARALEAEQLRTGEREHLAVLPRASPPAIAAAMVPWDEIHESIAQIPGHRDIGENGGPHTLA